MKKITLIIIALLLYFNNYAQNKVVYYTKDWKVTTKDKAEFYRPKPQKIKKLWLVKDYYINGAIQFKGNAKNVERELWEGDVTWYKPTGKIEAKARFKNGKLLGMFTPYEGVTATPEEGYSEADLYFYDTTKVKAADAVSTSINTYKHYYINTTQIAELHESVVGYKNKTSSTTYFDKKGKSIGKLIFDEYSKKYSGTEIVFYEEDCKYASECKYISIKEIITYKQGKKIAIKHYNAQEELIADGQYKNEKPYQGTFFKRKDIFYKIVDYSQGVIQNEIVYTKDNSKIAIGTYKNGVITNGKFYNGNSIKNYKNGKLDGKVIQYINSDIDNVKSEFRYKKGVKHGAYTLFSYGNVLEKGTYKKGDLVGNVWYYNTGYDDAEHNPDVAYTNYYAIKLDIRNTKVKRVSVYNSKNQKTNTFNLAKARADKFTYLKNGYHNLIIEDFNSDGHLDFSINATYFYEEPAISTYYLFNPKTNLYEYYNALSKKRSLVFDSETHTFIQTRYDTYDSDYSYDDDYVEYKTTTIFRLTNDGKLLKIEEIDQVTTFDNDEKKVTTSQIYPPQIDKFPLLNPDLPQVTFVQNGKEQVLKNSYQVIKLKKTPFSITFPLIDNTKIKKGFYNTRITGSSKKELLEKAEVGTRIKKTAFYAFGTAIAAYKNDLFIDDVGHNALAYEKSEYDKVNIIKRMGNNVLMVSYNVENINEISLNSKNELLKQPIYLLIFIDKNLNKRIEEGELHKVKILFEK